MHDRKVIAECVDEDNDQECQYRDCKYRNLATRYITDLRLAFPDQPASTEKCVAKEKSSAAQYRKIAEPAEYPAGILALRELQPFHQRADHHSLHEARGKRADRKTKIP